MFKKAAENETRRQSRAEETSRKNKSGIDYSAFMDDELEQERFELSARKLGIEKKIREIKNMLTSSQGHMRAGIPASRKMIDEWNRRRQNYINELSAIDIRLTEIKSERISRHDTSERSFERAFVNAAKALLAKPIFDRIAIAAIHKIGPDDHPSLIRGETTPS